MTIETQLTKTDLDVVLDLPKKFEFELYNIYIRLFKDNEYHVDWFPDMGEKDGNAAMDGTLLRLLQMTLWPLAFFRRLQGWWP